ncbi:MAG: hypothetical protein ABI699_00910 [Caldimonas sp.]
MKLNAALGGWLVLGALCLLAAGGAVSATSTVVAYDFGRQLAPWVVLGDGGRIEQASDAVDGTTRRPVMAYRYEMAQGRVQLLTLPLANSSLAAADVLSFRAKPSDLVSLVISIEEQGGGRWTASVLLPPDRWNAVRLALDDFVLATDPGDPADPNARLDMDRIKQVSIVDAAAFVAATSPDAMRYFAIQGRPRSLLLADVAFLATGNRAGAGDSLDGFSAPQAMWMVLGANAVDYAAVPPLATRGLSVRYERAAGNALSMMRRVPRGVLGGADSLTFDIASAGRSDLMVKVEQANGGKFEAPLQLAGDPAVRGYALRTRDFKASDDSRKDVTRLDWAEVTQLMLVDATGSPRGANQLWLARVSSNAPAGQRAAGRAAPAPDGGGAAAAPSLAKAGAVPTISVSTPGWSTWTKRLGSIHTGPVSLVGDPSVMRDGAILRMIYNCFDASRKRGAVCQATSTDGFVWSDLPMNDSVPGRMIKTRPNLWDDAQETPFMIKFNGEYLLYFIGYRDRGGFIKSFPAHVGFAVSRDAVNFERPILAPVLQTTPGGYDNDAISSPSVVEYQGKLVMLYTAHCWTRCPNGIGMTLMSATSTDGRTWVKGDKPVLTKVDFPKAKDGIAEAEVSRGPDGQYYLFYSLFYGDIGHEIGVARAPSPFGPWDIDPNPIIRKSKSGFDSVGPIAPTVVYEADRVRMWFHGFSAHKTIEIGYAEAPWPLRLK